MTPTLETARLIMRPHRAADFAASLALWGQESVNEFIGKKLPTEDEVWARVLKYAGNWALLGIGYWAVEERASGRYVGEIGFAKGVTSTVPEVQGQTEMGWVIDPAHHGKGYASEGIEAALAWSNSRADCRTVVCLIHEKNAPSLRVAAKAGFRERQRATFRGQPGILFERSAQP